MSGHKLSQELIDKYGVDRYPTTKMQFLKVAEELGELGKEINTNAPSDKVAKEYGDLGLAMYELGNKLGLDLTTCMKQVVDNYERK